VPCEFAGFCGALRRLFGQRIAGLHCYERIVLPESASIILRRLWGCTTKRDLSGWGSF
jgi:hypothetical protein